jgi:predicted transcriptional regulator
MSTVRRIIELDAAVDAQLSELALRRRQDVADVVAEAIELLESGPIVEGPDLAEDERRLDAFLRTRRAIPFEEVKAWTESWGTEAELPRPLARRIE